MGPNAGSLVILTAVCIPLTGCLVVGYSSASGWSIWPGGIVITLLLLLLVFLKRR